MNETPTIVVPDDESLSVADAQRLVITRPDDMHVHLRDEQMLEAVAPCTARLFGRAIIMPNLKPPITTTLMAERYRLRILRATREHPSFAPLMTLYLTDETTPREIERAAGSGNIHGVKYYPAGATTNSAAGVTDIARVYDVLETMQEVGMPLLLHGESTDPNVDVFDREAVFIDKTFWPLRRRFPALRMVLEHVSTKQGVQAVEADAAAGSAIGATITAQHLLDNRNALFAGGMRPHHFCYPILKSEEHRRAVLGAATSGNPAFFLGTDSAPHPLGVKECDCAAGGCFTAPNALALYAMAFDAAGALDKLEGFASHFGADFYRLLRNRDKVVLVRTAGAIPERVGPIIPYRAGRAVPWMVA